MLKQNKVQKKQYKLQFMLESLLEICLWNFAFNTLNNNNKK